MPSLIANGSTKLAFNFVFKWQQRKCKNPYHRVDLAVRIIRRKPIAEYLLKNLHVIFVEKLCQLGDEEITVYEYILIQ